MGAILSAEAGIWLKRCHGWNNTWRVIDIALARGWFQYQPAMVSSIRVDADHYQRYMTMLCNGSQLDHDDLAERINWLADDATEYLQTLAPDGFVFVWDAGELSLVKIVAPAAWLVRASTQSEEWAWV